MRPPLRRQRPAKPASPGRCGRTLRLDIVEHWVGDAPRQAGQRAYSVESRDWQALLGVIGGREVDVMVEAKGKEYALAPMGVKIV
jgi:hypothetical protein